LETHHDTQHIRLTSGEIAELFNTYITNKVSICILSYFNAKVEDPDMKRVLARSLEIAKKLAQWNENIFREVNHPLPKAFSEDDVNINAARLYSDTFMLTYVRYMSRFSLVSYSEARSSSTGSNVREFFDEAIRSNIELFDMADDVLLGKGLLSKPPYIPIPDKISLEEKQSFFGDLVGEKRPLNASEVNRIYLNHQRNALGESLLTGFIQTIKDHQIKEYFSSGLDLARKHLDATESLLQSDGLAVPKRLIEEVTESKEAAFSDRLMLFHIIALSSLGLAANGVSISRVMRSDIAVTFSKLMGQIALFSKDGLNLIIERNWLEQMPLARNNKELLHTR
jgi:hypothetical protein